jgi:hypothetical protein
MALLNGELDMNYSSSATHMQVWQKKDRELYHFQKKDITKRDYKLPNISYSCRDKHTWMLTEHQEHRHINLARKIVSMLNLKIFHGRQVSLMTCNLTR